MMTKVVTCERIGVCCACQCALWVRMALYFLRRAMPNGIGIQKDKREEFLAFRTINSFLNSYSCEAGQEVAPGDVREKRVRLHDLVLLRVRPRCFGGDFDLAGGIPKTLGFHVFNG